MADEDPAIGSTLLTALGVPSAAGTHRIHLKLPGTSQHSPPLKGVCNYCPLLCKQDSMCNQRNAF